MTIQNNDLITKLQQAVQQQPQNTQTATCPHCGYCPHCGRSAQPHYQPQPYYPPYYWPHYTGPYYGTIGLAQIGNSGGTTVSVTPPSYKLP